MTAKKKILYLFSFIVVAYTSFPSPAEGCGGCMISNFDRFLPPVTVWCIFIIVWFLAVSALEGGLKLEEALKSTQVLPDLDKE